MKKYFQCRAALAALLLLAGGRLAEAAPATGLWVGEVTLKKVNETVTGIKADKSVYAPNPTNTTAVSAAAHLRILFHVGTNGQVRLLKGVAMVNRSTNGSADIALISDPTRYRQYGTNTGSRITAVGFDFGDTNGVEALNQIALAAATAAANGSPALPAATQKQVYNQTNPPPGATSYYKAFLQSSIYSESAGLASEAATNSQAGLDSLSLTRKIQIANAAALKALLEANIFKAADALNLNEIPMAGSIASGGTLSGSIYLGADHPTNPFRHKWNPIHQHGYAITRKLTVRFDSGTNAVDQITGTYCEEIFGLHKPLGTAQDIGLRAEGPISLQRISMVSDLNP